MSMDDFSRKAAGLRWALLRRRIAAAAVIALLPVAGLAAETVRVAGTGAGLAAMRLIGAEVTLLHPEIETRILPSLGTAGGLRALSEGSIDIAIALRALAHEADQDGRREAVCAVTPLAFVSARPNPPGITRAQVPLLYSSPAPVWPDGAPMRIILRSRSGSENPFLIQAVLGMERALTIAYRHPGIPVGATDQENASLAQRTEGSLAVMTLLQLRAEKLNLAPVALDGVEPSTETLASGRYPMPIRLCLVLPAQPSSGAIRFVAYTQSPAGRDLLRMFGAAPSD